MFKLLRISDIWNRTPPENATDRIERALLDRSRRLIAGLAVDNQFDKVTGSLVVARGRGKSTSVLYCDSLEETIPVALRENCQEIVNSTGNVAEFQSCISELADIQTSVVERLKQKAAKYVDRILAIAVADPGWWQEDFDGTKTYLSFCNAARLAERTGVSVIDGWPASDIASGGKGSPVSPMPLWILQADRDQRIARQVNVSVRFAELTSGYLLPPSDGLDVGTPGIIAIQSQGLGLINGILGRFAANSIAESEIRQLLVSGIHSKELAAQWNQARATGYDQTKQLLQIIELEEFQTLSAEQLLCTAMNWICDQIRNDIENAMRKFESNHIRQRSELEHEIKTSPKLRVSSHRLLDAYDASMPEFKFPGKMFIDAPDFTSGALVSIFGNLLPDTEIASDWHSRLNLPGRNSAPIDGSSLIAAILGYLHVDQIPANVPKFTSARQPRILGRLTPGRPNSWRNLLREMADYEPPAMKLKDAV